MDMNKEQAQSFFSDLARWNCRNDPEKLHEFLTLSGQNLSDGMKLQDADAAAFRALCPEQKVDPSQAYSAWLAEVKRMAIKLGWTEKALADFPNWDGLFEAFDEGLTPSQYWYEEYCGR